MNIYLHIALSYMGVRFFTIDFCNATQIETLFAHKM